MKKVPGGNFTDFNLDDEGVLWISGRICVPNVDNLRMCIMDLGGS